MDDYEATSSLQHWVSGQTIQWQLTWPTHPDFEVVRGDGVVALVAPNEDQRIYRTGERERDEVVADAQAFILAHADVRGLKRGQHSTWRGAPWCRIDQ